jgi:hypothetical protein
MQIGYELAKGNCNFCQSKSSSFWQDSHRLPALSTYSDLACPPSLAKQRTQVQPLGELVVQALRARLLLAAICRQSQSRGQHGDDDDDPTPSGGGDYPARSWSCCDFLCFALFSTPGVVGGVVILPCVSHLVKHRC